MEATYTTRAGDAWDLIAYRVYGDVKYTGWLMAHNFPLLDVFVFDAGTVVQTPPLPAEQAVSSLPAWRTR